MLGITGIIIQDSRKTIENMVNIRFLGVMLIDNGDSKKEVIISPTSAVTELVKLEKIWWCREIGFKLKYKLYNSHNVPIWL